MPVSPKMRVDDLLVKAKLAVDKKEALALVMAGKVICNDQRVSSVATMVPTHSALRLKGMSKYVSRGGDKLEGAVTDLEISGLFVNKIAIDVGASTGGFTDYCLQNGAQKVITIDVGTNQLDWRIRNHPNVEVYEKTNIKDFPSGHIKEADIILADLSFIKLSGVIGELVRIAPASLKHYLLLIKPQFEVDSTEVEDNGIILSQDLRDKAIMRVHDACDSKNLKIVNTVPSRVKGRQGNQEFFLYCQPK